MTSAIEESALKTIHLGQENLLRLRRADGSWQIPAYLGPVYICQFYLLSRWAGLKTNLDESRLKALLLSRQLDDGSWYQIKDANAVQGELNVTILKYWTLKAMGVSIESEPMKKARAYILGRGGLGKADIFAVAILALFGIEPWESVPATPYMSFVEIMPMNYRSFAHWAKPHMLPLAYLARVRAQKDMGEKFKLDELRIGAQTKAIPPRRRLNPVVDGWIISKLLSKQGEFGSWNGYTTSTIFSLVALADFREHSALLRTKIDRATERGLKLLETLYLNEKNCPYVGISCDGTYWETILTSTALLSSGFTADRLAESLKFVAEKQMPAGGMPYGMDFQSDPDVDDTSASVVLWSMTGDHDRERAKRAVAWLIGRQNEDGGWGAFDQDNRNNPVLNFFLQGYGEVESLFDYSSADCTAHVLEAMALDGHRLESSEVAQKAVAYLKAKQKPSGAWIGRWALNTIFGTAVGLIGLLAIGESLEAPYLQNALKYLIGKQNTDGGFGESTLSYFDEKWEGVGISTPTQTAWALMAFAKAGRARSAPAEAAAAFLVSYFAAHGRWFDPSVTATGHPGQAYMHYSVYAPTFPIIALSAFLKARGHSVVATSFDEAQLPFYEGIPPVIPPETQL